MKKVLSLSWMLLLVTASVFAQSNNAILFTENGEKFQVILNGILQNSNPETNVKMTGLVADSYKCRIIFADTKLGYVDFNMFFPNPGNEVTWNIKQNKKGEYVTRWVSEVGIAEAPPTPPTQTVVVYTTTPAAPAPVEGTTTTTTVQHSSTTTTTGGNSDDVHMNIGMNVGGEGGSISINASGMDGDGGMTTGSSTTTTTTTTHTVTHSSSSSSSGTVVSTPPPAQPATVVYVPGYNGPIGCPVPMNPTDFAGMKETIRSKDFENTKLSIAKQVLQNNCLTAQQVKEVLGLFDFENTKLEYAKYAYDHTYDKGNYYKVNDAFEFESSVEDLNRYISGR